MNLPAMPSRAIHHLLTVALVVLAALAGLAMATAVVTSKGAAPYQARIAEAAREGTLGEPVRLPFHGGRSYHVFAHNECLVLSMLALPDPGTLAERIVSPLIPATRNALPGPEQRGFPPYAQCGDLARILAPDEEVGAWRYHRYLHGHRTLAGLLLAWLPLGTAGWLLLALVLAAPMAVALIASARLARRRSRDRGRDAGYLALAIALPLLSALPIYGRSIVHAPADIVVGVALLCAYLGRPWTTPERRLVAACAAFGALTAIFELLTGGLPTGIVLLLAVAALEGPDAAAGRRVLLMLGAYLLAFLGCFAVKFAAVGAIWSGAEIIDAAAQLTMRLGHAQWEIAPENAARLAGFGVSPDLVQSGRVASTIFAFGKLLYFSPQLGFGLLPLGIAIVLVGPATLLLRSARGSTAEDERRVGRQLLLAALVVAGWYAIMLNHTIVHAHFMVRLLAWPAALALAGEAWRYARRGARKAR